MWEMGRFFHVCVLWSSLFLTPKYTGVSQIERGLDRPQGQPRPAVPTDWWYESY